MTTYYRWGDPSTTWGNSGTLWGDPPDIATNTTLYWMIEVDWANAGIYTGENEAKYCIDLETNQGRENRLNIDSNGNADGIKMPSVGTARLVLDNTTGRFDPYNASGALYGNILPGRYIKIRVTYQGVIYPIFHGNIVKITTQNGQNPTVTLDCEDGLRLLQGADTSVPLSTDVFARNAVYQILESIDWPSRFGTITNGGFFADLTGTQLPADETNGTFFVIPYFSADGSAKQRIQELSDFYRGNFWANESGVAQFFHFARTFVSGSDVSQDTTLKDVNVPMPWENIITVQRTYYYPKVRQATGTIWQDSDNTSSIAASASVEIWADYTYNSEPCAALGVIVPTATTDYTMNTASDGSGTDLTASFTVVQTDFGNKSKLVVTNNSASTGYKTLLKIRGDAIANTSPSYVLNEDAGVMAVYGRRILNLKSPYSQTFKSANFSTYTSGLSAREELLECTIEARPDIQFDTPLFGQINAYFPTFGYNVGAGGRSVIIGHKTHKWIAPNGQAVRTTLLLEDRQ